MFICVCTQREKWIYVMYILLIAIIKNYNMEWTTKNGPFYILYTTIINIV